MKRKAKLPPMSYAEEEVLLLLEIGRSLTQWAQAEWMLFSIARACIESDDPGARRDYLGRAYFTIENFRSKLSFTNSLATNKFDGTDKGVEWRKLHDFIERTARKRNKLAHYNVSGYDGGTIGRRHTLEPFYSKAAHRNIFTPKVEAITLRDILQIRADIANVNKRLMEFWEKLIPERDNDEEFLVGDDVEAQDIEEVRLYVQESLNLHKA